ncbi:MAG TPA: transglutaminase family protein, partial [Pirellulales bacterium]|nr:transglutaminase family protein [Pirellulales bacterium]
MMRYKVSHTTVYSYDETVPICHNEVRLAPRNVPRQRCLSNRLLIKPQPASIQRRLDYFGNDVSFFAVEEGHQKLTVTALSKVQVDAAAPPEAASTVPWEQVRDSLPDDRTPTGLDCYQHVFDSRHVKTSTELASYAAPSFPPCKPCLEALLDLTRRIHVDFTFDSAATSVSTPIAEVLRLRRGVCQDFAHLEIGCLRSLGLAARYVSGYLLTAPPAGQPRLVGADASHAWLSVYCGDVGWIDVDPTNDTIPSIRHVLLAWGRDYSDVCPIKGVFIG